MQERASGSLPAGPVSVALGIEHRYERVGSIETADDENNLWLTGNYHLNLGAERLYVVLDRPEATVADALPDCPKIRWEVIDDSTWDLFYAAASGNVDSVSPWTWASGSRLLITGQYEATS